MSSWAICPRAPIAPCAASRTWRGPRGGRSPAPAACPSPPQGGAGAVPRGAATALAVTADGTVVAHVQGQGLYASDGNARQLDGFASDQAVAAQLVHRPGGDQVIYTANSSAGSFVRAARLDASGA